MSRYFVARAALRVDADGDDDDEPHCKGIMMVEHVAHDTGLISISGDKIMRAPRPIGFGRMEEW